MIDNESLPVSDDVQNQGPSEQELLDAVMKNSPIMDEVDIPLPEEELSKEDPVETADAEAEDPAVEEAVSEEVEEEVEETAEEGESEDDTSTQSETFFAEDLDLDAKVSVKIDGEEAEVSFGDLIKGYSTEQSLSKKGRELGEARKTFEEEKANALNEVVNIGKVASAMMGQEEQGYAKEYHELEAAIEKARKDGDSFEMNELKDKREQIQKSYWAARQKREGLTKQIQAQEAKVKEDNWNKEIEYFSKEIPNLIPDFSEKMANDIRDFAIEQGLKPAILDTITDPVIVKVLNDYRMLKNGVTKGAVKRKAIPTKKVPAKKAATPQKKAQDKAAMVKARAFKEDASRDDQMDFLKQLASNTLNNLK